LSTTTTTTLKSDRARAFPTRRLASPRFDRVELCGRCTFVRALFQAEPYVYIVKMFLF
jgi:hypothetical protein